jgi:hypothetical protein
MFARWRKEEEEPYKIHNEELQDFYSSPNIISEIK